MFIAHVIQYIGQSSFRSDMSPLWGSNSKGASIYEHYVPDGTSLE
jgi:hypothetical protein